jgi:drug/metabolite transporter (DMT)-like permease
MHWFFITLAGPFFYALTNHIDKVLLDKYFKAAGVGTLMIFSSFLAILALPIFYLLDPSVLSVSYFSIGILCFVGCINVLILWLYFLALQEDEASIVVVFYQLVPVFGALLGYVVLHETLNKIELIAMSIIIFGTTLISFEIDSDNKFKLKTRTIYLMTTAAFLWALSSVIFKYVELEDNVVRSLFWEHVTLTCIGILIFIFIKKYRINFLTAVKENSRNILFINITNEILYMAGNYVFAYAYLLAPIGLILLMNSFQPIFVFAIGIILTLFFPSISSEKIKLQHVVQKLLAITITGLGVYLLVGV